MTEANNNPEAVARLEQAVAAVRALIEPVTSDQLDLPTPCPDWDVKTVIGHIVGGNKRAATGVLTGAVAYGDDPPVGDNAAAVFAAGAAEMLTAMRQPGALERRVTFPFATFPGEFVAGLATLDLLSHGWDIARATGQAADFDPALCAYALGIAHQTLDWAGDDRSDVPWAPATSVAPDVPAADRLAAFVGRQV